MPCPESNQPSQIDLAHARRAAIEELFDEATMRLSTLMPSAK